ncbi:FAD-dependent monooxygenase [Bradyrhizobium sp. BRP22]|uniref:FAD-dependent monooxygenase n=1 Tax=Bradyrhizobium sp. BRP22 TaxID=2793821 RepID=UPI001CD24491|nr:FAD-dependent monooxygenase [Bradyrhizobium sp. BRP22]MCA1457686.1 FAD-dependent monooxygenase [Bradyrhizobium sp. BRP22]
MLDADVVVVGAGPVGLTLAMDLAWRGRRVTVLETRRRNEPPSVKSNHVSARSMEIFRRLGVAAKVRNAGLPPDYPNDVAYRTSFLGHELTRIKIPCRAERYTSKDGPDTWWPTPEPPHRINQIYLEPVLFEHLSSMLGVRILSGTSLVDFRQSPEGVIACARERDTAEEMTLSCRFLVGCDGGRSLVRNMIGGRLSGDPVLQRVQSSFIRAPKLLGILRRLGGTPAWASFALNPRQSGNVYAIDGRETWLVHVYLNADVTEFDAVDRDSAIRTVLGVDQHFQYELLAREDWIGRRLITDKVREERVFICGDACHLWVPYAGYGMNAGIADAANLAWLLAAHLEGWADERILNAYEAERLPITEQVSHFAMNHADAMAKARKTIPPEIEVEGPEGNAIRSSIGQSAYDLNVQQYCCAGLNFGYYYQDSPIIAYDDEIPPPYTMGDFRPSTAPGARVPHFWLADGRSIYDAMGPYYTLLRTDPRVDVDGLTTAAAAAGVPLTVLDTGAAELPDVYRHSLSLARPDQHVAWRGDRLPDNPVALMNILRGSQGV